MHNSGNFYPHRRVAPFQEWSPSVHYAKFQKLPDGRLPGRRIYDFELLYVRQGEAATWMNGERHLITAGQLIFIPAGVYHQNEVVSTHAQFLGIHFDFFDELEIQSDVDMVVNEMAVQTNKFGTEAVAETFEPLTEKLLYTPSPPCIQLMEQLVHEFTMRFPGYTLICKSLMLQILGLLLRTQKSYNSINLPVQGDRILEMIALMEANPAEPWTNCLLSKRLNMNQDHMIKVFKKMAGMPPGEYLQMLRHREARMLLRETNLSVEEIGRRVGYPDIHYFSRLFRKCEGISPRMYRNLSRIL